MDLIPQNDLDLNTVAVDPIGEIIRSATVMREMPLDVRARLIAELVAKIDQIDTQTESTFSRNMMLGIGSSFSMAAAIASTGAFAPVAGICLSVSAVGSWGFTMYEVFTENMKLEPIRDAYKRLSLALKSASTDKWAAVWAVAGDDIFIYALKEASKGDIVRNQLVQLGGDRPIDRAIDCVASFKGSTYEQITASARALLAGQPLPMAPVPTRQPQPTLDAIDVATMIGADLSEGFEKAKAERKAFQNQPPVSPVTRIQPPVLPTLDVVDKKTQDIVELILASIDSIAFIGKQRSGKSRLMAIASKIGLQQRRFNGVFIISSLSKAGEDEEYWNHCVVKTFFDLKRIVDKTPYYGHYLKTIREFKRVADSDNPQLLIIDEYAYLCERLEDDIKEKNPVAIELMKELADIGSVLASGGAKNGWYVWAGSPQGNIGFMGRGGTVLKKMALVFCAISPEVYVKTGTGSITWDEKLFDATAINWKALKKPARGVANDLGDRIVWMDSKWHTKTSYNLEDIVAPVDQTQTIEAIAANDALDASERQSLQTAIAVQERSQADLLIERLERSKASSIEEFVRNDLRKPELMDEVKPRIIAVLKRYGRNDLLQRFAVN